VLVDGGDYWRRKGQALAKGNVAFDVPDDIEIPLARGEKASIKFEALQRIEADVAELKSRL
jgi:hypothetical protein